ncbi:MAG: (d)CMP kinase [Candidatus Marinimicrobia bacterium]|mgnify:FL=1|jgi:cytidylate kinase|nr:(d)CMP kinase [Candidatus Neomarinimicrobiota bacterium]MBT3961821.1 (d)CMP kinase [Candidatus Neomarinimicrobiota bacterium]MBT4382649.1 (d)CMP kinase [Candidatus Neomarinimicrobiota bacterium]MBT4636731.1 (d)CMP kinase [Candidatus Neomarinimicrobiota bacterium]MBT4685416.1 (d)CMP kinase [Candidatus Neomarinimicrobiota bacterium]
MIIAIDGPAASGKSTTAKGVSRILRIPYLDTGSMYRAITHIVITKNIDITQPVELKILLSDIQIRFEIVNGENCIFINNENVSSLIRSTEVTLFVSAVSAIPEIRKSMVELQRAIGKENGCVIEGRDIGTVVFPNADYKFFLVADVKVRAERRLVDLEKLGETKSLDDLMFEIEKRDLLDSSREHSPLRQAKDAIEIDTSLLSISEQIEKIVKHITNKE